MKILILQLKRIGDVILTTPVIRSLRDEFPEAHLTLAVDSSCAGLLDAIDVDERLVYHKKSGWSGLYGPNSWMKDDLSSFHGDYCLDFTGTDRSGIMAFLTACRHKVTYERFRGKFLRRFVYTDFVDSSVRDRHTADHHVDLLQPLGIKREGVPLDLRLPEATVAMARALVANSGVTGPYAVIHAGTARPEKYWVVERWVRVMEFLSAEYGLTPVLTGSKDADEQKHLVAIKEGFRGSCVDLSGQTDLIGLAALIQGAKIFCGVDTAAMHLADAVSTPAVALFGPTNPYHWRPRHTTAVVIRADTREPFSPKQKGGPMDHIEVAAVTEGVRSLLL